MVSFVSTTYCTYGYIYIYIIIVPASTFITYIYCASFSESDAFVDEFALGNCYCFVASTLLMLGSSAMPNSYSNRIAFISIVVGGTLIYWYWEAMLTSYLAVRTPKQAITTLSDLAQNPNFKVCFFCGGYIFYFFIKPYISTNIALVLALYLMFAVVDGQGHLLCRFVQILNQSDSD